MDSKNRLVKELYGYFDTDSKKFKGKGGSDTPNITDVFSDDSINVINEQLKETSPIQSVITFLKKIEEIRKTGDKTVKATPNNPSSSRSHLIITLNFYNKQGKTGKVSFVDMAGIEDPFEISVKTFPFKDIRKFTWSYKQSLPPNGQSDNEIISCVQ